MEVLGLAARVDGQAVYFIRGTLKDILKAKRVIVGVNEYVGAQVMMRFDMPDQAPVMDKCGSDWVLKPRGKK